MFAMLNPAGGCALSSAWKSAAATAAPIPAGVIDREREGNGKGDGKTARETHARAPRGNGHVVTSQPSPLPTRTPRTPRSVPPP